MKIVATSDPHQMISKWKDLVKVCQREKPDITLICGDLFPKDKGITEQKPFMKHLRKYAKQIRDTGSELVLIMGNDDNQLLIKDMDQSEKDGLFHHIHEKVVKMNGHEFVGMPWVPDYPFSYKFWCRKEYTGQTEYCPYQRGRGVEIDDNNECKEIDNLYDYFDNKPSIEDSFNRLIPQVEDMSKSIWLIHSPPCGYQLDVCASKERVGSKMVMEFIHDNQPMLTIHGHIHESPRMTGVWKAKIGRTLAIQNGQLGMSLHYNIIHMQDGYIVEIERYGS